MNIISSPLFSPPLTLIQSSCAQSFVHDTNTELRTPLNAACSGIQLLKAELSIGTQPEDIDRLDTLNDVALSITTTVDIRKYLPAHTVTHFTDCF